MHIHRYVAVDDSQTRELKFNIGRFTCTRLRGVSRFFHRKFGREGTSHRWKWPTCPHVLHLACVSSIPLIVRGYSLTMCRTLIVLAVLVGILGPQTCSAFSLTMQAGKAAVVAGATGYIGKSTVRESVRQGYKTIALVRDKSAVESSEGAILYGKFFEGAEVIECDVCNPEQLTTVRIFYARSTQTTNVRTALITPHDRLSKK